MRDWPGMKPLEDWEKCLLLLAIASGDAFRNEGEQKRVAAALFGWDRERTNLAFGELTRREMATREAAG